MEVSITARIATLQEMNLGELRGEFEKVLGKASLSRNRKVLVKRIAEKIQGDAATPEALPAPLAKPTLTVRFERKGRKKTGGKTKGHPKAKAATKGKETATPKRQPRPAGQRDPRLPKAGTTITREWHGKKYLVRVLDDGFEYDGKPFRSLSGLARHITGQIINGFLFWGLVEPEGKKN